MLEEGLDSLLVGGVAPPEVAIDTGPGVALELGAVANEHRASYTREMDMMLKALGIAVPWVLMAFAVTMIGGVFYALWVVFTTA